MEDGPHAPCVVAVQEVGNTGGSRDKNIQDKLTHLQVDKDKSSGLQEVFGVDIDTKGLDEVALQQGTTAEEAQDVVCDCVVNILALPEDITSPKIWTTPGTAPGQRPLWSCF